MCLEAGACALSCNEDNLACARCGARTRADTKSGLRMQASVLSVGRPESHQGRSDTGPHSILANCSMLKALAFDLACVFMCVLVCEDSV